MSIPPGSSQTQIHSRPETVDGAARGEASTVTDSPTTRPPSYTSSQTVQLSFQEVLGKELLDLKRTYQETIAELDALESKQEQSYKGLSFSEKAKKALSLVKTPEEKKIQELQRRRDKLEEDYNAADLAKLTLKAKEISESTAQKLKAMEDEARNRYV